MRQNRTLSSLVACTAPLALLALAGSAFGQTALNGSDTCSGASVVTAGIYLGTTAAATNDGVTTCGSSNTSRDVWYRYVAPGPGSLRATTCGSGTLFDTVISAHNDCTRATSSQIAGACNDDACGSASTINVTLTAGQSILIRVGGFSSGNGAFRVELAFTPGVTPPPPGGNLGPDVTVGNVVDVARFGTNASGAITAYSVGTDSCNRGDVPVSWYDTGPRNREHPVIAQNMFRYKVVNGAGQFEMLGQSWLKHGFLSLNSNGCGTCITPPDGGDQLGVNCSDVYGAGLNGSQSNLGPRSQVNASTGAFPMPHGVGSGIDGGQGSTLGMRLQVPTADVTGTGSGGANFGAQYWVDTHYVTMDDAQFVRPGQTVAINGLNNASYRKINIANGTGTPTFIGGTVQLVPGIFAWRNADPLVNIVAAEYPEQHPTNANATILGRFWVGAKATQIAGGMWHYEYAIYNLNSDRSGGSFTLPLLAAASLENVGFRHPRSHSGEPFANDAWTTTREGNSVTFSCPTFTTSANANAIRWGTMYTLRFDSNAAPNLGEGTIGLFKPAAAAFPNTVTAPNIPVPTVPPVCVADINGDGLLDSDDLADYITCFFSTPPCALADQDFDNVVTPDDLSEYVANFFAGCP